MRFAIQSKDPRLHTLVVALDRDGTSMAETWRAVGDAAESLGMCRPSYESVRRLASVERLRRRRAAAVRRAAFDAASAFTSPHVVEFAIALDRLRDARGDERLVTQQHEPARAP